MKNSSSLNQTCWNQMVNFVYDINTGKHLKCQIFNLLKFSKKTPRIKWEKVQS